MPQGPRTVFAGPTNGRVRQNRKLLEQVIKEVHPFVKTKLEAVEGLVVEVGDVGTLREGYARIRRAGLEEQDVGRPWMRVVGAMPLVGDSVVALVNFAGGVIFTGTATDGGGGGGSPPTTVDAYVEKEMYRPGLLQVANSAGMPLARAAVLTDVEATLDVAGSTTAATVHVWRNGVNIHPITFAAGATTYTQTGLNVPYARGERWAIKILTPDSGATGSGLAVTLGFAFPDATTTTETYSEKEFYRPGLASVGTGPSQPISRAMTIKEVEASLEVAPTTTNLVAQIFRAGVSIQSVTFTPGSQTVSLTGLALGYTRGQKLAIRINSLDSGATASGLALTLGVTYP